MNMFLKILSLLIILIITTNTFSVYAAIDDYRFKLTGYIKPINKFAIKQYSNGKIKNSVQSSDTRLIGQDIPVLNANVGDTLKFADLSSSPEGYSISTLDFQYISSQESKTQMFTPSQLNSYSINLTKPCTWEFFLCTKDSAPNVNGFDNWSDNGNHQALGKTTIDFPEGIYWYFTKVIVVVDPASTPTPTPTPTPTQGPGQTTTPGITPTPTPTTTPNGTATPSPSPTPDPRVFAKISFDGNFKEYRAVTAMQNCTSKYPIVSYQWSVTAASGKPEDIKTKGLLSDPSIKTVFMSKGLYEYSLTATNSLGFSDTVKMTVQILEDKPPVASLSASASVTRDREVNSVHYADIPLTDLSYSPDGDTIYRKFTYAYDSDNNGTFGGESEVLLQDGSSPNATIKDIKSVGHFLSKVEVYELVPYSDTIPEFFDVSTYREGNYIYIGKNCISTALTNVDNVAPTTSFDMVKKKKVDLVIYTDYQGTSLNDLNTQLTNYRVNNSDLDLQYTVVSTPVSTGSQTYTRSMLQYGARVKMSYYLSGFYQSSERINYNNEYTETYTDVTTAYVPLPEYPTITYYTESHNKQGKYSCHKGTYYHFYDIANPSHIGTIDLDYYRDSQYSLANYSYSGINISYIGWQPTGVTKDTQVNYTVYACNTDTTPSIRAGAEASIIFLCNSARTDFDYYGQYFPFSKINNTTLNYAVLNQAKVYAVAPAEALTLKVNGNYNTTCSSQTKTIQELITTTNGKSYASGSLAQCLNGIKGTSTALTNNSYVLVDDVINNNIGIYTDFENDKHVKSRIKYTHTPTYFTNSNIVDALSGIWQEWTEGATTALKSVFSLAGKYDVEYQVQDDPTNNDSRFNNYMKWSNSNKITVIAHRLPIAHFTTQTKYNKNTGLCTLSVVNDSYDLDHSDRSDNGIKQSNFKWRNKITGGDFAYGLPSTLTPNQDYEISLSVVDLEGATSSPYTTTITPLPVVENSPPTVTLNYSPNTVYENDTVILSYTPDDLDKDTLNVTLELKTSAMDWTVYKTDTQAVAGQKLTYSFIMPSVETQARVTVKDPSGEVATANLAISPKLFGITAYVLHNDTWNNYRIGYNRQLTGKDEEPRLYNWWWRDESLFIVCAKIDPITGSNKCTGVKVKVYDPDALYDQGDISTVLDQITGYNVDYYKEWSDDRFDRWASKLWSARYIFFNFTATFSNGAVKTFKVPVYKSNEEYFRIRRGF